MSATNGPTTVDFQAWMRDMEKRMNRQERRLGGVTSATIVGDGASTRATDGVTGGDVVLEPPASSPTIGVTGMATGLMVVATNIDPTSLIAYRIDGEVVRQTRSTAEFFATDAAGNPLELDTDYTVDVLAYNDAGSADPSPAVVARLDPSVDPAFVRAIIEAGFILAGTIQVGNITIRPGSPTDPGGITIPLANGGVINFPADGSDAVITARLYARSLVTDDYVEIYGDNNKLFGTLTAENGITAPQILPSAVSSWEDPANWDATGNWAHGGTMAGFYDNGTEWLFCDIPAYNGWIRAVNKSTGVQTIKKTFTDFRPAGGLTKINGVWIVLGLTTAGWTWRKFNSSWVQIGSDVAMGINVYTTPVIGANEAKTALYMAWMTSPTDTNFGQNRLVVYFFNDTTLQAIFYTRSSLEISGGAQHLRGLVQTQADFAEPRFVAVSATTVFTIETSGGTRHIEHEWNLANGEVCGGIVWDPVAFRFRTLSANGVVYTYLNKTQDSNRSIAWARYNHTSGHKTQASPQLFWTQPARTPFRVDTPPPGGTGDPNDPDSVLIYLEDNQQPFLGVGVTTGYYGYPVISGPHSNTTNDFGATTTPGQLKSKALAGTSPVWNLYGSGDGTMGPLGWGSTRGPTRTSTAFLTGATGWTVGNLVGEQFGMFTMIKCDITRSGGTITNNTVGDITNVTVANLVSGWIPYADFGAYAGQSGRMASWRLVSDGQVQLCAIAGSADITTGQVMSLCAFYIATAP